MAEILRQLTYKKRLLTDQEIAIILYVCVEQLTQREIAEKLAISTGTLRRYLYLIREKFSRDICQYAYLLKNSILNLSLLWLRTVEYESIKEIITTCQKKREEE